MFRNRRLRAEAAGELELYGLGRRAARREAQRAVAAHTRFLRAREELNGGDPAAVAARIGTFRELGDRPDGAAGALLLTLHYGLYPLLWLWLKSRLENFTLLYSSELYRPDVPPAQYARYAELGVVPASRDDLDLAVLGARPALAAARERLLAGGAVLMFPDATAVDADKPGALVCRVGARTVAYPGGAAALAQVPGLGLQGVVLRDDDVVWAAPHTTPASTEQVAEALQELFDLSVARDPAQWQAWLEDA